MFKPDPSEYDPRLSAYLSEAPDIELLSSLTSDEAIKFYKSIPENKLNYGYAEGKWNIKEILNHLIDGERIFSFRALWFARNIQTPLPSFDEKSVAKYSNASTRSLDDLLEEYACVRKSTFFLFKNFDEDVLKKRVQFSDIFLSVKALGYLLIGHENHHIRIIKEKYL